MVFECVECQYKTDLKFNYQKHLKTNKHFLAIQNEEKIIQNEEKSMKNKPVDTIDMTCHQCQWCRRYFSRNDNLQRHQMVCYAKSNIKLTKINNIMEENDTRPVCGYCQKKYASNYRTQYICKKL